MNKQDINSQTTDDFFNAMKAPLVTKTADVELISDDEMLDYCFDRIEGHRKYQIRAAILNNQQNAQKWRSINNSIELIKQNSQQTQHATQGILGNLKLLLTNNKPMWTGGLLASAFSIMLLVTIIPSAYTISELTEQGYSNLEGIDLTTIPMIDQELYQTKGFERPKYQYPAIAAGIRSGFEQKFSDTEPWIYWLQNLPELDCNTKQCSQSEISDFEFGQWLAVSYLNCESSLNNQEYIDQQVDAWNNFAETKHALVSSPTQASSFCGAIKQTIEDSTQTL